MESKGTKAPTAVQPDLVYDVGVGSGSDSAYYLHKGFRVLGVEADPVQAAQLRRRFESEIRGGRYRLIGAGIAEGEGEAEFFVCDDDPGLSSFNRANAAYGGARHHPVIVETRRFASLLLEFGVPFYCKIDIEGNDELCVEDLKGKLRPPFVSVEVDQGEPQVRRLQRHGYSRFKLISQLTLRQPRRSIGRLERVLPASLLARAARLESRLLRRRDGDWRFESDSSGPFGEQARGHWLTADECSDLVRLKLTKDYGDWFDIHAALGG